MAERLLPTTNTLIKYDNPILITRHEPKKHLETAGAGVRRKLFKNYTKTMLLHKRMMLESR